jgi:hypothetical protein
MKYDNKYTKGQNILKRWMDDLELLEANSNRYSERADKEGGLDTPDKIQAGAVHREITKIKGLADARAKAILRKIDNYEDMRSYGIGGESYDDACYFLDLVQEYKDNMDTRKHAASSLVNIHKFPIEELEYVEHFLRTPVGL